MIDNTSAYQTIGWILDHSDDGFFSLIASESMQSQVAALYKDSNVAVYDYLLQQDEYTFQALKDWICAHPDKNAYFLLNFQRALLGDQILTRLNFSRDMLRKLNKNIIFCMTRTADDLLNKGAYDFYSYIKLVIVFQDEFVGSLKDQAFDDIPAGFQRLEECNTQLDIEPYEQWPEEKQLAYAISLSNRAEAFIQECRYSDARRLLETALNIKTAVLGAEHPSTGTSCNNLAGVYRDLGDYAKALEYSQKSLAICKRVFGTEHSSTGTCYNNLAGVYRALGDYAKAGKFYKDALAVFQAKLGLQHPNTTYVQDQIEALKGQDLF